MTELEVLGLIEEHLANIYAEQFQTQLMLSGIAAGIQWNFVVLSCILVAVLVRRSK